MHIHKKYLRKDTLKIVTIVASGEINSETGFGGRLILYYKLFCTFNIFKHMPMLIIQNYHNIFNWNFKSSGATALWMEHWNE